MELWSQFSDRHKGIACVLLGLFALSLMDVTSKLSGAHYDALVVTWWRFAVQAALVVMIFRMRLPQKLQSKVPGIQVFRAVMMLGTMACLFSAYALMPLADAIALFQLAPIGIAILAMLFLNEHVSGIRWIGMAIALCGAMLVAGPRFTEIGWGVLFPLGAATFFAAHATTMRLVGKADSVWTTFAYTGVVGTIAVSLLVPISWELPAVQHLPLLISVGLTATVGTTFIVAGFQYCEATVLAPLFYLDVVLAAFFGYLIFGDILTMTTLIGACFILGSNLALDFFER